MRCLIATIAIIALALPATAQEQDALILDMRTESDGRHQVVESHSGLIDGTIRASVVGHFLWLEWGDVDREYEDLFSPDAVSIDVSDTTITRVVAYLDGTIDIVREAPTPEPPPEEPRPEPVPETRDLVEEFPQLDWRDLLPAGVRVF